MPSVLEKWHPVTRDFGLINASIEQVLSQYLNWNHSLGLEHDRTEIRTTLEDAFESLLPLANSKMRKLFVPTRSNWIAFFQNGIQGSDPSPPMAVLAERMKVLSMRVCCTPDNAKYPATIWEIYAPESLGGSSPLNSRRSIAAMDDGGRWIFEESGERFPFEQVERYAERRKRDRFTREMLREYLSNFGLNPFSDDFFNISDQSPAVRLQRTTKVWHTPEFTLEEVVAGVPWQRKVT
jgi:hypothetical protein